jgi:hypothetical protein
MDPISVRRRSRMVFEIDPDKPNIPALARILSAMGIFCLIGSLTSLMLAFSGYEWINEIYAMAGAVGAFLLALLFAGQAKTLELLAVVSARVKSRFAIDSLARAGASPSLMPAPQKSPSVITQPVKERVIHVPDDQAREQGFKVR